MWRSVLKSKRLCVVRYLNTKEWLQRNEYAKSTRHPLILSFIPGAWIEFCVSESKETSLRCWFIKNCTSATPLSLLIRICFCYIEFDFNICNNIHIYVPHVHHTCNPAINATEGAITTVIALQGRGNKGLVYEGIQIQDKLHLLLSLTSAYIFYNIHIDWLSPLNTWR